MANWLPSTKRWRFLIVCCVMCFGMLLYFGGKYRQKVSDSSRHVRRYIQRVLLRIPFVGSLFGGKYKQKLLFVPDASPDADNEPKVGHAISEPALFRFLLDEENSKRQIDDEAEAGIPKMLNVLKDVDKNWEIKEFETHQSSMGSAKTWFNAFHVFIVFKTTSETDGVYWWSLEKGLDYITLQRSRNKENVKDKLKGKQRTKVKLITDVLKGKGTIKDLFGILWAQQLIPENYHIKKSNCQSLVSFIGQQITEIGYKYKGYFPYSPPRESGRDKKMLELINLVITGCSDWSPLFHLIKMGNIDYFDKIVASGKYDINASCNGRTPLHLAIRLGRTKMVKHLLQPPLNADPTKRDEFGRSALLLAANSRFGMKEEIIDLLLEHDKVNVDDVDEVGQTALYLAACVSNVVAVRKLIEKRANPNIYDKRGHSPLHMAVQRSDSNEIIDLLLAHGMSACQVIIDHADSNGETALHLAAWASNVVAVQKLLEKGANPNIFDKWGRSPLYTAVLSEKSYGNEIMDLLLAHDKVNVDDVNAYGKTALHIAAHVSNVIAVEKLLEKGANPKITDKKGMSPLHWAAKRERNGNEHSAARQRRGQSDGNKIMDLLLAHSRVKVDDVDEHGQTALHAAVSASNVEVVKYLINKGANLNAVDKWGDSPLLVAARQRDGIPIIDLLLEAQKVKGIGDVNDQNEKGRTALHYAAAYSNEITAEHLIKKGANVNCRANVGLTPLHYAALGAKDMKIIDLLLENINEGDIQHQYRNDERLFFFARHNKHGLGDTILNRLVKKDIQPSNTETDHCTGEFDDEITGVNTRRFVDKGVDPSIDLTGFAGLDFLITRVKISLGIYDDINGRDQNGETLLLVAIRDINVNAVKRLLENGADPTIRDEYGYTPFHVAVENNTYCDILNLLLENGKVDINETTEYGRTALHLAIMESNTATVEFLLSKGANPNVTNKYGDTPLHYAAKYAKDMDIVELLVNHPDVNVNYLDNNGHSALYHTKWNYHGLSEAIANLLKEKGAVKREYRLLSLVNPFIINCIHGNTKNVLSDATVPIEDKIARIMKEHLISAIQDSDVERVRRLLKNGADISSARGEDGENALHVASRYAETTDIIDEVLKNGKFDINGVDNDGLTPLHWAIRGTNRDINARHLIQLGADPNIANKEGDTPLHFAAFYAKTIETINLILENKQVDINSRGAYGETALHRAIRFSKTITVHYLLKKGADPNSVNEEGDTPLHFATDFNSREIETISLILENEQVDINSRNKYGWTALHNAIISSNVITVRYLLKKDADPNIADRNGATPLHLAAKLDNYYETTRSTPTELINIILETGKCNINGVDDNGRTPLHYAISGTNREINARHLLEKGADPSIADKKGYTPFHLAAALLTDSNVLGLMLGNEIKIDIDAKNNDGATALHLAIDKSNVTAVRLLLSNGANPNVTARDGLTPLHLAVKYAKDMEIVELLLNKKYVNCLDNYGYSALDYAMTNKHGLGEAIANLLREKMAQ